MSEEEIERLRNELRELEDESYKELRRQMDLLAADETMDDAQKEAFYAKIREELAELEEAVAASDDTALDPHVKEELGDLLFSVTNLARHLKADSESALEGATAKFARRFRAVEAGAKEAGRDLKGMSLAEMETLWDAAKGKAP